MEAETKKTTLDSLKNTRQWMRVLYMVLFAFIFYVVAAILFLITVIQAMFTLLTGSANEKITTFGDDISRYIYQITQFWTYNSEDKPKIRVRWVVLFIFILCVVIGLASVAIFAQALGNR